jgi:tetratricopeptide (TPR) repeat protein
VQNPNPLVVREIIVWRKIIIALILSATTTGLFAAEDQYRRHLNEGKRYFLETYHGEVSALLEFEKAALLRPDDPEALFWLARALHHVGQFEKSLQTLEKARKKKPDDWRIHAYLAFTYGRLKYASFFKQAYYQALAITEINKTIAINPNCADCYNAWGLGFKHLGLSGKAEKSFLKAIKINPEYYWPPALLGGLYLEMEKVAESEKYFEKALALAKKQGRAGKLNDNVPRGIALFYENVGMWDKALKMAELALSWNPDDIQIDPRYSIRQLIDRLNKEKETGEQIERSLENELLVAGLN